MKLDSPHRILKEMDDTLDQRAALGYVARFKESGFLTEREAAIIMAALDRQVLKLGLPQRDILRANLLKVMLLAVLRHR